CAPKLDFLGAEAAQLGTELGGARRFRSNREQLVETRHVQSQNLDRGTCQSTHAREVGRRQRRAGLELGGELAAQSLELEPQRLRGFAREPELAALRVPTDSFGGHRSDR